MLKKDKDMPVHKINVIYGACQSLLIDRISGFQGMGQLPMLE
jgi:hypothetical protein